MFFFYILHTEVLKQYEILKDDVVAKSVRNVSVVDNRPARTLAPHGAVLDEQGSSPPSRDQSR